MRRWRAERSRGFAEPFHDLWRYYLMYCEGGFRGGAIDVAQVTMVKARQGGRVSSTGLKA